VAKTVFKVEGLKDLEEALKGLSRATGGSILKKAVTEAAVPIALEAQRNAPLDEGILRQEIKVSKAKIVNPGTAAFAQAMKETGDRAIAVAAARAANREAGGNGRSATVQVGPTKRAGQGVLQEFGTAHHRPQPFMRPAWGSEGRLAPEIMRDVLREGIDKAIQRAARKAAREAAKMRAR
jgi:HK97 gp10 family phage protein